MPGVLPVFFADDAELGETPAKSLAQAGFDFTVSTGHGIEAAAVQLVVHGEGLAEIAQGDFARSLNSLLGKGQGLGDFLPGHLGQALFIRLRHGSGFLGQRGKPGAIL